MATDIIQQVLATDDTFGPALLVMLELQYIQGDEMGFTQTFMMSLGDEVPAIDQLSALYRAGELLFGDQEYQEASKHWDFCARQAEKYQNDYFAVLSSFRKMEAQMLLHPSEEADIVPLQQLLAEKTLHISDRTRFKTYLTYLMGLNALNTQDNKVLGAKLSELESITDLPKFGVQIPSFQDLKDRVSKGSD